MIHTERVRKALQFAARKHNGQFRKEIEPLPYITHPVSVALLLADGGADEDTIMAGLLHDTIEDTETTYEDLVEAFGARVADLVCAVSEPKVSEDGTKHDWHGRKNAYLKQLFAAEDAAVLVSMADKIDNIESKLDNHKDEGDAVHARFGMKPEEYLWFHSAVLEEARKRNITGALRDRLESVVALEQKTYTGS
jgi:(p)ppGpp synthase/HD superfamily hydrolase